MWTVLEAGLISMVMGSAGRDADFEGSGREIDIDGFPIKRAGTGADVGSGSYADGTGLPTGPG